MAVLSSRDICLLSVAFVTLGHGARAQLPSGMDSPESLPIVEVMLAPPTNPWPQVSAELGKLERARHVLEEGLMGTTTSAFNYEMSHAQARIRDAVDRALQVFDAKRSLSFFAFDADDAGKFSFKIKAHAAADPDPSIKQKIDMIEHKRAQQETALLSQQASEMKGLTDVVVHELESQIRGHVDACLGRAEGNSNSFLQLPKQTNVRVRAPSVSFPSISSMVQELEARRDANENSETAQVLELQMKLLRGENDMVEEALRRLARQISAHCAPTLGAVA